MASLIDCLKKLRASDLQHKLPDGWETAIRRVYRASKSISDLRGNELARQVVGDFIESVDANIQNLQGAVVAPEGFSLASSGALEALANRFENTKLPPEKRLRMYEEMAETMRGMQRAMKFNDAGESAMEALESRQETEMAAAREDGWSAARRDALEVRHRAERAAVKAKTDAKEAKRALQILDAMLVRMPSEIRGKIRFADLADARTDAARAKLLLKKAGQMHQAFEKLLRDEYRERIDKIFSRSEPKGGAGEKAQGKLGALGHAWFDAARAAAQMTAAQAQDRIAALDAKLAGEITPDDIKELARQWGPETVMDEEAARLMLQEEITIVETFGGMEDMSAADLERAHKAAVVAYDTNRSEWMGKMLERRERRQERRTQGVTDGGGAYDENKYNRIRGPVSYARGFLDMHLSFEQAAEDAFGTGSKTHTWAMKESRKSADKETDLNRERRVQFQAFMRKAFGGPVKALNTLMALQKIQDTGMQRYSRLSQLQAVHFTMLAADPGSAEWMAGHGLGAEAITALESFLTEDAKKVRSWLMDRYDAQYDDINAVHVRLKGVSLPRVRNYAPRLTEHSGREADMTIGQQDATGMITGFLRRRFDKPAGPPKIADALQVFWANQTVVHHWLAWAETMGDFRAVLGSRDVRLATGTHRDKGVASRLQRWLRRIEEGGVTEAISASEVGGLLRRWFDARAKTALFGKLSVLMKQTPAMLGSAAKVGPAAWMRSAIRVNTGRAAVGIAEMFNSPVVQRRINAGDEFAAPAAKGAQNTPGMALVPTAANVVDFLTAKTGGAIGVTDAAFTTWSAAVAYDASFTEAKEAGMDDEAASALAWERTAEVVAQTAQPQNMIDKSLLEVEWPTTGRLIFAFQGANRQAWSLLYQATKHFTSDPARAAQTYALYVVVIPTLVYGIAGLWNYLTTDDDWEDEWSVKQWGKQIATAPLQGLIVVGPAVEAFWEASPRETDTPIASDAEETVRAFAKLRKSDEELRRLPREDRDFDSKDAGKILNGLSTAIGGRAAVIGIANNVWQQIMGVRDALKPGDQRRESVRARENQRAAKKAAKSGG